MRQFPPLPPRSLFAFKVKRLLRACCRLGGEGNLLSEAYVDVKRFRICVTAIVTEYGEGEMIAYLEN